MVIFQGNLGQPPRELQTRRGERGVMLNLASNEASRESDKKEYVTWAGVACYGALADYVLDVLRPYPGDELFVIGKLNSYTTTDRGARRSVLQIAGKVVLLLRASKDRPDLHYHDERGVARAAAPDDDVPF